MSVPINKRSGNELQVLNLSLILLNYTFAKTQKPKHPKDPKQGGCFPHSALRLANQIWDLAYYGDSMIHQANDYIVHSIDDYKVRRELQLRGRGYLAHLPRVLLLAHTQGFIPADTLEYWAKLVTDTLDKLGAWIRSDEKRFSK